MHKQPPENKMVYVLLEPHEPMAVFFSNPSMRLHHLCTYVARLAERIPQIPRTRTRARSITTGRPHVPSFFPPPPPARRRLEPAPSSTPSAKPHPASNGASPRRRPINRQIPFSHVYVLDPTTNKLSAAKHRLEDLLAAPPAQYRPQQQQQQSRSGNGSAVIELVASVPEPVVRVTTRSEVEARYRAMRRTSSARRADAAPKEVRLSWGVARGDWEHKIRKARRELEKSYPVVVAVAMKRRQRPSNRKELVAFADEISQALSGVGQECKEREITERSMILSFRKVGTDGDAP